MERTGEANDRRQRKGRVAKERKGNKENIYKKQGELNDRK